MPKLVVDKSLFEPIEVEVGEKTYRAAPFSPWLIRAISELDKNKKDDLSHMVDLAALIFGISSEEVEKVDLRALAPAIEFVTSQMNATKTEKKPGPEMSPAAAEQKVTEAIAEAQASKNAPKPGGERLP